MSDYEDYIEWQRWIHRDFVGDDELDRAAAAAADLPERDTP